MVEGGGGGNAERMRERQIEMDRQMEIDRFGSGIAVTYKRKTKLLKRYKDDNKQTTRERKKAETKKGNVRQEGRNGYDKERYSSRVLPFYRTVKQIINS